MKEQRVSLLEKTELFVLDMDGTFYLGERILEGALEFLQTLKETGRRYLFFTNNSSFYKLNSNWLCSSVIHTYNILSKVKF